MLKVYLAGPDVFAPFPQNLGGALKRVARAYGFEPLYPMDNALPTDTPQVSLAIYQANAAMIRKADLVVANMTPFRGHEPDSGTVWEVGFALGLGKRVIGYLADGRSMLERVSASEKVTVSGGTVFDGAGMAIEDFGHPLNLMLMHSMERVVIGDFEAAMAYAAGAGDNA